MSEIEQLRKALDGDCASGDNFDEVYEAARAYLSLLEQHPGVQGLIDGTHYIEEVGNLYCEACESDDCSCEDFEEYLGKLLFKRNAAKSEGK